MPACYGLNMIPADSPHSATLHQLFNHRQPSTALKNRPTAPQRYAIRGFDQMPPFFMSVVSDSNFWMFISSVGALTCGRVDANSSVFPYYTVDKIHDSAHLTGPLTVLRVTTRDDGKTFLWEPFVKHPPAYCVHRTIYKNMLGNRLEFEEVCVWGAECAGSGGGGFGTRPWWLALLACGGAYWPLALEPSAMTSRHPYYCGHPYFCGHPPAWVGIQNATSAHGVLP